MGRVLPEPRMTMTLRAWFRACTQAGQGESFQTVARNCSTRIVGAVAPADRPRSGLHWQQPSPMASACWRSGFSRRSIIREYAPAVTPASVAQSPFHLLAITSDGLMDAWRAGGRFHAGNRMARILRRLPRETAEVSHRLENEGVSVDIVYGIGGAGALRCQRMEAMLDIHGIAAGSGAQREAAPALRRAGIVVAAHGEDRSIRRPESAARPAVCSSAKIVDRSGRDRRGLCGAHTRRESIAIIWLAAAGGGAYDSS